FFTSRSRHTKLVSEWSSAVCSSVLLFGRERADRCAAPLRGRPYDPRSPADAIAAGVAYVPEDRPRHGVLLDLDVGTNVVLAVQDRLAPRGLLAPAPAGELPRPVVARRHLPAEFLPRPLRTPSRGHPPTGA